MQAQANQSLYWIYPDADWLIHFSARRYEKLTLSVDQRSGGSGPRDFKLQYSLNGVDFTDIPSSRVRVTGALKPTYTNFALPDELSGEKSVYIRIKICGNENVEGKELDDPTVIGSGKTSVNNIIIKGIKLPSMLSNVEENDSAVSAVLTNLTQAAITPVAVLTRYQAGMAVKTDILNINTLAPGEYAELNFSAYADDYNKMKIMVFDSLGSMKPLCDAYELGGVKNPSLLSYVSYSEGASAVLTNNTGSPITPVVILSRYKDGLLVKASVEQIEVLNEGDQVIIRFPDCEEEYDDVKMLVFNGFDSMQPLN